MTFGYARVSTQSQNVERQIRNILAECPDAVIYQEKFTGKVMARPEWQKLLKRIREGDTIIFDSVSRMSRDAEEGVREYFRLDEMGVQLVFLNERSISTSVYHDATRNSVPMTGTNVDVILAAVNVFLKNLAAEQIRLAFDQAEKERKDLSERTKGGIETARRNGKQIGQEDGRKLVVRKAVAAKEIIRKHNKDFGGDLNDEQTIKLCGVSRNSFYKYKAELRSDPELGERETDETAQTPINMRT